MHVYLPRLSYRRFVLILLAVTCAVSLLLFGNYLFSHHPHQAYAQTPAVNAAILVVQSLDDGPPSPGDPSCGITCTLRDAVRTANALAGADTIVFADGLAGEITLVSTLIVTDDVTIEGPGTALLTISMPGNDFNNRRVLQISGTAAVTLRGMTIQRTGDEYGGGIRNLGDLTIEDIVVTNSDYNGAGGGLYNSGALTVVNSVISDNRGLQGGGIFNAGSVIIVDSRISGSNSTSLSGEGTAIRNAGGVISMTGATIEHNLRSDAVANYDGGRITIEGSTFENNVSSGLRNEGITSTLEIRNSDFISNGGISIVNGGSIGGGPAGGDVSVTGSTFEGPALLNRNNGSVTLLDSLLTRSEDGKGGTAIINTGVGSTFTMSNTTVTDNFLTGLDYQGAGIINERGGVFLIEQSAISNNRADEDSVETVNDHDRCGGILNHGDNTSADAPTTMTIRNSTISGNRALRSGGGLCAISGLPDRVKVTVIHSTIVNNRALEPRGDDEGGGGIFILNGDVTLVNSIVASNYRGEGTVLDNIFQDPNNLGTVTTQGVNLSDTQPPGFGVNDLTNEAPLLGPLSDNGGPTATHALLSGSPALDAASGDMCPDIDQRGEPRPADGNDDTIAACDIGAYEAQGAPPPIDYEDLFLPVIQSGT